MKITASISRKMRVSWFSHIIIITFYNFILILRVVLIQ